MRGTQTIAASTRGPCSPTRPPHLGTCIAGKLYRRMSCCMLYHHAGDVTWCMLYRHAEISSGPPKISPEEGTPVETSAQASAHAKIFARKQASLETGAAMHSLRSSVPTRAARTLRDRRNRQPATQQAESAVSPSPTLRVRESDTGREAERNAAGEGGLPS